MHDEKSIERWEVALNGSRPVMERDAAQWLEERADS
jgi:hypothetical protein